MRLGSLDAPVLRPVLVLAWPPGEITPRGMQHCVCAWRLGGRPGGGPLSFMPNRGLFSISSPPHWILGPGPASPDTDTRTPHSPLDPSCIHPSSPPPAPSPHAPNSMSVSLRPSHNARQGKARQGKVNEAPLHQRHTTLKNCNYNTTPPRARRTRRKILLPPSCLPAPLSRCLAPSTHSPPWCVTMSQKQAPSRNRILVACTTCQSRRVKVRRIDLV